ncbi:MAG: phytanoyl-CoA dioxygenase family protein [Verrucomicrobia bacterium]|nr:phytanoyl-CoA dioxygenase family protein [Verrucomicrobiota bacterium]
MKIVNAQSAFRPPVRADGTPEPILSYWADDLTRDNKPLHALLYSGLLLEFYREFLDGPIRHYTYTWLRAVSPGLGTPPHCDLVYMGRGTGNVCTTWTPLSDVPLAIGGLMILKNSHCQAARLAAYLSRDVDTYCTNGPLAQEIESGARLYEWDGTLSQDPVALRNELGGRWLTAESYGAGDILIFSMRTIHASLDNQSDTIRLSSDSRYQLAAEPINPRNVGENPSPCDVRCKQGRIC